MYVYTEKAMWSFPSVKVLQKNSSKTLITLLQSCWNLDYEQRPTFEKILKTLSTVSPWTKFEPIDKPTIKLKDKLKNTPVLKTPLLKSSESEATVETFNIIEHPLPSQGNLNCFEKIWCYFGLHFASREVELQFVRNSLRSDE